MRLNHFLLFAVFAWSLTIPEIHEIGGGWGAFDWLRGWFNWVIRWPVNGIRRVWNATLVPFLGWLSSRIDNLLDHIKNDVWPAIKGTITSIGNILSHLWNTVWPAIKGLITSIADLLSHLWNTVWPAIKGTIISIGNILSHLWNTVWPAINRALDWIHDAGHWIADRIEKFGRVVQGWLDSLKRVFTDLLYKLKDTFLGEDGLIMKTIKGFISLVYDTLIWFVEMIWGGV